ncbi:MAG: PKD domain-containing protein [Saprospiraceae bacterium]|nr:PKD domain-containing protein [Saprospiraceae bacterium]
MIRIILFIFLIPCLSFAQSNPVGPARYDNTWLNGYCNGCGDTLFGGTVMNFNVYPPSVSSGEVDVDFYITNSNFSNAFGNLVALTNGYYIGNASYDTMPGGDSINSLDYGVYQDILPQGTLFLPQPGNDSIIYLIHEQSSLNPVVVPYSFVYLAHYSIINILANNGQGEVVNKNISLLQDTLCYGKLTAVKHGNGRDWWFVIPAYNQPLYYKFLLTPNGIDTFPPQLIGGPSYSSLGQAVFAPNGSKYIRLNNLGYDYGYYLDIMDFDRCSGMFSNYQSINGTSATTYGLSVSPNSKYLYFSKGLELLQYDLSANNINTSEFKVADYDGFENPLPTIFGMSQLAPDGKIYVSSNWNVKNYHVIQNPNEAGFECKVAQHSFYIPKLTSKSIPTFPNYRLGPLDGSSCDTLGINNLPIADFRMDTVASIYQFQFVDLSYYEPTAWYWTFGDGGQSTDQNPIHTYNMPGVYEVCLVASNAFAADTLCKSHQILSTNAIHPPSADDNHTLAVFPNPVKDKVFVSINKEKQMVGLAVYNSIGQRVLEEKYNLPVSNSEVNLGHLPNGIYVLSVYTADGEEFNKTLVVAK